MKYNKYKNIYNYYRGPSYKKEKSEEHHDKQIEDNTTKALINTLQYISNISQINFLNKLNITTKQNILFDLQPTFSNSRPDAVIKTKEQKIYIESKVASEIDINQLGNHLKDIKSPNKLIVITNNSEDFKKIKKSELNIELLSFFTWNDIGLKFKEIKPKNELDIFLINQFINYLEDNNMTEFNGWKQKDFDAFLFIQDDTNGEARKLVKKRFNSFIEKLKEELEKLPDFSKINSNIMTAIKKDTNSIWGNYVKNGEKNINIAHLWIDISANGLSIGINNEGKNSTQPFIKNLSNKTKEFTNICKKLDSFSIDLNERYKIHVMHYGSNPIATIRLGKNFSEQDTQYLINKINELNNNVEFRFFKHFNRDMKELKNDNIIKICKKEFENLIDLYKFNQK